MLSTLVHSRADTGTVAAIGNVASAVDVAVTAVGTAAVVSAGAAVDIVVLSTMLLLLSLLFRSCADTVNTASPMPFRHWRCCRCWLLLAFCSGRRCCCG